MGRQVGGMHAATIRKRHVDKAGQERLYLSHLLRRTFREDGKVKHETLANLSALPDEQVELLRRSLQGEAFTPAGTPPRVLRSLPHGHSPRSWPRPGRWVCPHCWVRRAGSGTWPSP